MCAALMETAHRLASRGTDLRLSWAPRGQNVEADELSNGITRRFDPRLQVGVECRLDDLYSSVGWYALWQHGMHIQKDGADPPVVQESMQ